ncbi:hypothetical protein TWF718_002846 [Orbilia javanica]|uniref:Uncharacterized protein n=1 Tax=Orbilia javanica TaxID=47235 RepID=A0AAN8R979_9PEZI
MKQEHISPMEVPPKSFQLDITHQTGWISPGSQGPISGHKTYTVKYKDPEIDPLQSCFKAWRKTEWWFTKYVVALYNPVSEDLIMADEIDQIPSMILGSRRVSCPKRKLPDGVVSAIYDDKCRYKWCPVYQRSDFRWIDNIDPRGVWSWDYAEAAIHFVCLSTGLWDDMYAVLWLEDIQQGHLLLTAGDVIVFNILSIIRAIYQTMKALVLGYWSHVLIPVLVLVIFRDVFCDKCGVIPEAPQATPSVMETMNFTLKPGEAIYIMDEQRGCLVNTLEL